MTYKCKMCGGTLEIQPGESVAVCDSCGSKQTIPNLSDERRANLYDRANHFRRANEFDKAMGLYEQILNEDNNDAEAHWSVVLCRYGIEYVEDPATHKRVPTVNRTQYTSILSDEDYKAALRLADGYQRDIYQAEAKAIDEIQKGILAISQKEEPFDVFISYKETDAAGRRTPDSVLATDLYHQLTKEGFKVFLSRITLEDKLGQEYEPYIFAALNSAKVMVVVGTKPEYFNAVWVKNEWSRYLSLIRSGEKKTLIPAYRDMDPYDLPDEFSHLMAQDMSKLGFMQDLIHVIKKICEERNAISIPSKGRNNNERENNSPISGLLERAFLFLDDSEFDKAREYADKVLDIDPKNAQAYLCELLAENGCAKKEDLGNLTSPFNQQKLYKKIIQFGDENLAYELEGYNETINSRIGQAFEFYLLDKKMLEDKGKHPEQFLSENESRELESLKKQVNQAMQIVKEKEKKIHDRDLLETKRRTIIGKIEEEKNILKSIGLFKLKEKRAIQNKLTVLGQENESITEEIEKIEESIAVAKRRVDEEESKVKHYINIHCGEVIKRLERDKVELTNRFLRNIRFGRYEQGEGQKWVEWIPIVIENDKALLISKYALDCQPYDAGKGDVTWETCTLRKWLNEEFLETTFNAYEQDHILTTLVTADKNPMHNSNPGNTTEDRLFLLSSQEFKRYFHSTEGTCYATIFCRNKGVKLFDSDGGCVWWLRTPGLCEILASIVDGIGSVNSFGLGTDSKDVAVRPAFWISLE